MISVCMATYNGAEWIEQQVRSILPQLTDDDELVISDDGSTDNTLPLIASIADPRISILHNEHDKGIKGNFENALAHAKGDIIFLADQDDIWLDGKVAASVEALRSCDLVLTDCYLTDADLNIIEPSFFKYNHSRSGLLYNILIGSYYGCCMAMKRHVAEQAMPIPRNKHLMHDLWLGLVAEMTGSVRLLTQPLLLYRRHDKAFTQLSEKQNILTRSKRNMFVKLWTRIVIAFYVLRFRLRQLFS